MRSTIISGALFPMLLLAACSSSRQSVQSTDAGGERPPVIDLGSIVADDTARAMIRQLEAEPLVRGAIPLRTTVFAWVIGTERLHGFSAPTTPVEPFNASSHPYKEELMMQYLFGAAAHAAGSTPDAGDVIEQQMAGIRSMIAAYRNMIQSDPSLHDPFLDHLDDLRRRGELRWYIQR